MNSLFWQLELHDRLTNASKFYRIIQGKNVAHVSWGRCGTKGSEGKIPCERLRRKIEEKTAKGYSYVLHSRLPFEVGDTFDEVIAAKIEKSIQQIAASENSSAVAAFRNGKPDAVAAFPQWSQWGKGWEWMTDVKKIIETGVMHWDRQGDVCFAHINSKGLKGLLQAGVIAAVGSWSIEEMDKETLETAAVLWEPGKNSTLQKLSDALESARLL